MRYAILALLIVSTNALCAKPAGAQASTGIVMGTVTDPAGIPLRYASIVLVGTPLGAMATCDGWYAIHDVPPGVHAVRAAMLGYASVTIDSVVVVAGRATRLNVHFARFTWQLYGRGGPDIDRRPVPFPNIQRREYPPDLQRIRMSGYALTIPREEQAMEWIRYRPRAR